MSDSWPLPSSSTSPIMHQAPPLSSALSPGYHGNPSHAKVSSYHLLPEEVTPPHHYPTPLHLPPPPTAPEPQATPHLFYQPQETSPHFLPWSQVTPPHLLSPPQCHFSNHSPDPGLHNPDWSGAEARSCRYSHQQNQTSAHLDLQNQNQLSHHRPAYDSQSLVYEHGDVPGPVQDAWRSLGPTLSQLQCSPLGSPSGWSSVEFSSPPADDSAGAQFFYDGCHDNSNAPQPFCSPNIPGPSPHYPQTPQTISSPGPHTLPREERPDFQTSRQVTSDLLLLLSHRELIQDQGGLLHNTGCYSPGTGQEVCSSGPGTGAPAGLSWREEGGGGKRRGRKSRQDSTWVKQPQTQNSTEAQSCRLLCTVCQRDFRSLPALNGHMRSHIGSRSTACVNKSEVPPSVSMMSVTVPIQSRGKAKVSRSGQVKCSPLPPATGGAVLYRSLLHQEEEEVVAMGNGGKAAVSGDGEVTGGDGVSGGHYIPPPMLCPLRAGPGLYCSITTRRQQSVQTVQLNNAHNGLSDLVATETASPGTLTTAVSSPRINVGRGFQAKIPPLLSRRHGHSDSHNALLLWTPRNELEHAVNQQRVEALMLMARSSVVPGGGASPESALHVLSECRGDFLLTMEKLLSTPGPCNDGAAQQFPSVRWSAAERKLLLKSLQLHHKDFARIQKTVQTKSVHQCVEFYYLWKKKLSLGARTPAGLTVTLPNANQGQRSSPVT